MRPLTRNALLAIGCAAMVCGLAAAVAGFALTGRGNPVRHPAAPHRAGVMWISSRAAEPGLGRQRVGTASGAPHRVSVPFLRLTGGVVGSLPDPDGLTPGRTGHIAKNWWEEGDVMCWRLNPWCVQTAHLSSLPRHRQHRARHRQPPPDGVGGAPRTLPRHHAKTGKNGARTRPRGRLREKLIM
jgi:hypothetical protein